MASSLTARARSDRRPTRGDAPLLRADDTPSFWIGGAAATLEADPGGLRRWRPRWLDGYAHRRSGVVAHV